MHSMTKGKIGELAIRQDLLSQGYNVYIPEVDVTQVDMIVETSLHAIKRIQIKCVSQAAKGTAIHVDTTKYKDTNRIDVVAIYYEPKDMIAYVPYENTHAIILALTTGKNNQTKIVSIHKNLGCHACASSVSGPPSASPRLLRPPPQGLNRQRGLRSPTTMTPLRRPGQRRQRPSHLGPPAQT